MFCFTLSKSTLKALELYLLTRLSASILETGTKNTRETCMDVVYPVGKRMFKVSNIRNRKTAILIIDFEEKFSEWVLGCSCWNLGMFFLIPNKNKTST